jgi:CHRD domain
MRKLLIVGALALLGLVAGTGYATASAVTVFTVHLAPTASGDQDGSGVAVLRLDLDHQQICYTIVVRNIGQPVEPALGIGSAHIHTALTGGVFVNLLTDFRSTGSDTYIARGCVSTSTANIEAILSNPDQYYVNVHTVEFPRGAIQGSLG